MAGYGVIQKHLLFISVQNEFESTLQQILQIYLRVMVIPLAIKQKEIKLVIGAGEYNNNLGWLHTNEEDLNLLKRED